MSELPHTGHSQTEPSSVAITSTNVGSSSDIGCGSAPLIAAGGSSHTVPDHVPAAAGHLRQHQPQLHQHAQRRPRCSTYSNRATSRLHPQPTYGTDMIGTVRATSSAGWPDDRIAVSSLPYSSQLGIPSPVQVRSWPFSRTGWRRRPAGRPSSGRHAPARSPPAASLTAASPRQASRSTHRHDAVEVLQQRGALAGFGGDEGNHVDHGMDLAGMGRSASTTI